jgi:hypothetical protein
MANGAKLRVGIGGLGRAGRIHLDAWWQVRQHLAPRVLAERIVVADDAPRRPVTGGRVVVELDSCTATLPVPLLDPGQRLTLRELDRGLPGAELRVQVAS